MKLLIRAMIAVVPEEITDARQSFYENNSIKLEWPDPWHTIKELITASYLQFGVPTPQLLKKSADTIKRSDLHAAIDDISIMPMPTRAEVVQAEKETLSLILVDKYKESLQASAQILVQGKEFGKVKRQGLVESVRYNMEQGIEILGSLAPNQRTSTLKQDMEAFRSLYVRKRDHPQLAWGMGWGIKQLDDATAGIQAGQLAVVAAFAGQGKSTMMMNMLYHQVMLQSFNAYLWSGEMSKEQLWQIFGCIHSRAVDWGKNAPALSYERVKMGQCSPEEEDFLLNTLIPDLQNNPAYGNLYIEPSDAAYPSLNTLWTRAEVINSMDPLDMICLDYDALIQTDKGKNFGDRRANLNQIILDCKQMAKSFCQGRMIGVMTAHQTNREGFERANKGTDKEGSNIGVYDFKALSEANEIERSSDHIIATWQNDAMKQRGEARITHLKNRDGRTVQPFDVYVDADGRYVGNLDVPESASVATLLNL